MCSLAVGWPIPIARAAAETLPWRSISTSRRSRVESHSRESERIGHGDMSYTLISSSAIQVQGIVASGRDPAALPLRADRLCELPLRLHVEGRSRGRRPARQALVDRYLEAAERAGSPIVAVFETHVQADHVSGLPALVERRPARPHTCPPVRSVEFAHVALADGQTGRAGQHDRHHHRHAGARTRARRVRGRGSAARTRTSPGSSSPATRCSSATSGVPISTPRAIPSHSPSAVLRLDAQAARARTTTSLVYPSHFGGSVCGRASSANPFSTIGFERRHNPALRHEDPEAFAKALLVDVPPPPERQAEIVAANRRGRVPAGSVTRPAVQLGLRANAAQFSLLVLLNALVGAMVGLERSVLPLVGEEDFGLESKTRDPRLRRRVRREQGVHEPRSRAASPNEVGRKRLLVLGLAARAARSAADRARAELGLIVLANLFLGVNQGFAWSMTVVMKIDLVGPTRRGLALGLNESAGYLGVAAAALATGALAATYRAPHRRLGRGGRRRRGRDAHRRPARPRHGRPRRARAARPRTRRCPGRRRSERSRGQPAGTRSCAPAPRQASSTT